MPVKIKCSNCEKVLSVPDAARGKAVKCPQCQTRIVVPAASSSPKSSSSKSKPKKSSGPVDSEEAFANLDMSRVADSTARICIKCGFDMRYQEEEDTECGQCGFDAEVGGLGARARKKAMKGPDPADFYKGLVAESWKFVGRNYVLAWRTVLYTLICLSLTEFLVFSYLYLSMWPTRVFLALCFTISFLVIPGWMWFLDVEIIKLTLERKDKFKKLNFDFFLSSALGAKSALWCCIFAAPIILLPAALGYFFLDRMGGNAAIVLPICAIIGAIPSIWMFPVVMAHMCMPVEYRAWMVWKIMPISVRNVKPLMFTLLWFIVTNIPSIAGLTTIAAVYGSDIANIVATMEKNAEIERQRFALVVNPNTKKKGQAAPAPVKLEDTQNVDLKPLIVPVVILAVVFVINGFTCLFNMRLNGQFVYYNKNSLELIDRRKEYKYVAKEKTDENEEDKPPTLQKLITDAVVFFLVFDIFGLIGGMLYGSTLQDGQTYAILIATCGAQLLGMVILYFQSIAYAFHTSAMWAAITIFGAYPIGFMVYIFKDWENRKDMGIKVAAGTILSLLLALIMLVYPYFQTDPAAARAAEFAPPPQAAAEQQKHEAGKEGEVKKENKSDVLDLQKKTTPEATPQK